MTPLAQRLLANNAYDIEYNGFLTNHVKHAIVALDKLDASTERTQEYWDFYTTMTPYNIPIHPVAEEWNDVIPLSSKDEFDSLKGQKTKFQQQVKFLQNELSTNNNNNNVNDLVRDYVPPLINGMVGALTHTIIHLGWGLDADSSYMTLEGIAYLNFAHVGFPLEFDNESQEAEAEDGSLVRNAIHTDIDMMDSLLRIADVWHTNNLGTTWIDDAKSSFDAKTFHPELVSAGFQWDVAKVIAKPHEVATQLPTWITSMPLPELWKTVWYAVTYVFLATRDQNGNSNFIVLHLLSSLWGLEKTLQVINDEDTTRRAIGHYFANVIVLLSTPSAGFPQRQSLVDIQQEFPVDDVDSSDLDWTDMVNAGIAEEEEHNIKLVYVCQQLWNRYGYWKGFSEAAKSFTLTPNVRPAQQKENNNNNNNNEPSSTTALFKQ